MQSALLELNQPSSGQGDPNTPLINSSSRTPQRSIIAKAVQTQSPNIEIYDPTKYSHPNSRQEGAGAALNLGEDDEQPVKRRRVGGPKMPTPLTTQEIPATGFRGEDDRVTGCSILIKSSSPYSHLGWVELRCSLCRANCRGDGVYFSGIKGMLNHLSTFHTHPSERPSEGFSNKYIFENCISRQLSENQIAKYKIEIGKDRNPISQVSQPSTSTQAVSSSPFKYEDDRVEGCPVLVKSSSPWSDLGWVELHCAICRANCRAYKSRSFFSGIGGTLLHLTGSHRPYRKAKRRIHCEVCPGGLCSSEAFGKRPSGYQDCDRERPISHQDSHLRR